MDIINQYNQHGQKHGFWLKESENKLNPFLSTAKTYYNNGKRHGLEELIYNFGGFNKTNYVKGIAEGETLTSIITTHS